MTAPSPWVYVVAFFGSLALTWGCMPLALRFAARHGVVDRPGGYKVQDSPVPYLGGVVIGVVFALAVLTAAAVSPEGMPLEQLAVVLLTALGLGLMGLADDLWGLSPYLRLALELGAALVVLGAGPGVAVFGWQPLNGLLTVVWVVGVTNAFNLLDNMDGLSGGVAAIGALTFFATALLHGQFLVAALAVALAGCALGFLRHNFHPARIYMGDAGSLFLGFLLAVLGLRLRVQGPPEASLFVPVLALGVALFDMSLVVVTRIAHGRNPLAGGRDHVSHRLVFMGLPVPAAVALIYAGAIALGWLAVLMTMIGTPATYVLMGFALAVALFFAVMLGRVPVYENSKRARLMLQRVAGHEAGGAAQD